MRNSSDFVNERHLASFILRDNSILIDIYLLCGNMAENAGIPMSSCETQSS
jgi:hypothetical protein